MSEQPFAVSLGEFIDRPRPEVRALLADEDGTPIIAVNSLVMLGARGGRGKTTFFIDLMVHLALGEDYLCFKIPAPVRVLVIENEGSEPMFAEKRGSRRAAAGREAGAGPRTRSRLHARVGRLQPS